jgi:hypothetical protein
MKPFVLLVFFFTGRDDEPLKFRLAKNAFQLAKLQQQLVLLSSAGIL